MVVKAQAQMMSQQDAEPNFESSDSDITAENSTQENSPSDKDTTRSATSNQLNANKIATYNAISKMASQHTDHINLQA